MHRIAERSKLRWLAGACAAGCLLSTLGPVVWAETSKSRVGYRSQGHYARPAPPPPVQQPTVGTSFPGTVSRTQQKYYRIQPPYASKTQPFQTNPNYPSGQPIDPSTLPNIGAFRYLNVLPQPVVYLPSGTVYHSPADVLRAESQPITPPQPVATTPAGAPIYIVVQPPPAPVASPPQPSPAAPRTTPLPAAPRAAEPKPPQGPGGLRFEVQPADARVFLDDRLLGEGAAISGRAQALELDAGVYMLEVSHPDHRSERLFFGVYADREVRVEVDLTRADGRRRSWVESGS